MDWMACAQMDWNVYHEPDRTAKYVQYGKIAPEQYQEITGQPYPS